MPFPVGVSLADLLGMGYAGAVSIDTFWLMLRSSSISEDDNLIKSQGAIANSIANATGEIPVRNRRSLTFTLTCDLTHNAISCMFVNSFTWRNAGQNGRASLCTVRLANGEGYATTEAYVESINISVSEGQLGQITFQVKSFLWDDLDGLATPRNQTIFNPYAAFEHQPIPYWSARVDNPAHPGVPVTWSLGVNHGYQYYQLCEVETPHPPTPRVIIPGPLLVDLNMTTLAIPAQRPGELANNVVISIAGGSISGVIVPLRTITMQKLYRDPQRLASGFGDQNQLIKWQAAWKVLGPCPVGV